MGWTGIRGHLCEARVNRVVYYPAELTQNLNRGNKGLQDY